MTPDALVAELERLHEAATKGPWEWTIMDASAVVLQGPEGWMENSVMCVSPCKSCQQGKTEWEWGRCTTPSQEDAALIAFMRTNLPAILSALRTQQEEIARLRGDPPG